MRLAHFCVLPINNERRRPMVTRGITFIRGFSDGISAYATYESDIMQPTVGNCKMCLISCIEFYPIDLPREKESWFYGKLYIRCMSYCFFSRTIYTRVRAHVVHDAREEKRGCPTEKTGPNTAYYRVTRWRRWEKHFSCHPTYSLIFCQTVAFISGIRLERN